MTAHDADQGIKQREERERNLSRGIKCKGAVRASPLSFSSSVPEERVHFLLPHFRWSTYKGAGG